MMFVIASEGLTAPTSSPRRPVLLFLVLCVGDHYQTFLF